MTTDIPPYATVEKDRTMHHDDCDDFESHTFQAVPATDYPGRMVRPGCNCGWVGSQLCGSAETAHAVADHEYGSLPCSGCASDNPAA